MVAPAATALDRIFSGLVNSLSSEAAENIAQSKLDAETQKMIDQLAEKSANGTLSAAEREQYIELVEAIDILSIFQAKARKAISNRPRA
jgi:hypothetical protein